MSNMFKLNPQPTLHSRRDFLKWSAQLAAGSALTAFIMPSTGIAAPVENGGRKHDDYGPPIWPSYVKIEALLQQWARKYPDHMKLEVIGRSTQGRPLYVIKLTDPKANDESKEHILLTGLHSGQERSSVTTILCIIEWLLSGDRKARAILRQQVVVCIPVADPDRYESGQASPVYVAWNMDGPLNPEKSPEAMAVKQIMDLYQPEVHADLHGVNLGFARYIMFENSASSYSNTALRPYHRDIIRQMDEAALAEGYPSDLAESDSERLFWGPALESIKNKLWRGRPGFYGALYCYCHYHTMICASEVLWERSGLLRHRRLLEIGNETWPGELYPGYPVRVVMQNPHAMLTSYGNTAAARRRSRVELWNKLDQLTLGMIDPVVEGKACSVCTTSTTAAEKLSGAKTLKDAVDILRTCNGMNIEVIQRFCEGWPGSQNNPEACFYLWNPSGCAIPTSKSKTAVNQTVERPVENGLCLRLRLPYDNARLLDVRLNGHPLPLSKSDGYVTWTARSCTFIQVNVPPDRARRDDMFVITCNYEPTTRRKHWDNWRILELVPK